MVSKQDFKYFVSGVNLDEPHQKYCRCLAHVAGKQPDWCLKEKAWFQTRNGKKCVNPFAVCTASVRRTGLPECFTNYSLDDLPEAERKGLILLKEKDLKSANLPQTFEGLKQLQDQYRKKVGGARRKMSKSRSRRNQ